MATSDLHARLWPFDYIGDVEAQGQGLAVLAGAIETMRSESSNTLLVDNGDTLEGTPLADLAAAEPDVTHPVIAAMNEIGFDAAVPGNHDFNFGLPALQAATRAASFPFTLSNLCYRNGTEFLPRSLVLTRDFTDTNGQPHQLRIGLVGLAPPQITDWDHSHLQGALLAEAIVPAARRELTRLRNDEQVDLTIALCHSGIDANAPEDGGENAVVPLAAEGLADVIIAGHSHQQFPGTQIDASDRIDPKAGKVHGVSVVQPAAYGRQLGIVDVQLTRNGNLAWQVSESTARLVTVADAPASPAILAVTENAHRATRSVMDAVIGENTGLLGGYFDLFSGCGVLKLISEAQEAYAAKLLENPRAEPLPLLSAVSPTRNGGLFRNGPYTHIPVGPIRRRHVFDLYGYANRLTILKIGGEGIRQWLEQAARAFNRIIPGVSDQKIIDFSVAGYNFDVIAGLTYEFDITEPSRARAPDGPGRVRNLCHNGQPVAPDQMFHIAVGSYRASGGGGYIAPQLAEKVLSPDVYIRDLLEDYIRTQGTIAAEALANWRFADAGGLEVIAETGPGAAEFADFVAPFGLRFSGISDRGLAEFKITI